MTSDFFEMSKSLTLSVIITKPVEPFGTFDFMKSELMYLGRIEVKQGFKSFSESNVSSSFQRNEKKAP